MNELFAYLPTKESAAVLAPDQKTIGIRVDVAHDDIRGMHFIDLDLVDAARLAREITAELEKKLTAERAATVQIASAETKGDGS